MNVADIQRARFTIAVNGYVNTQIRTGMPCRKGVGLASGTEKTGNCRGMIHHARTGVCVGIHGEREAVLLAANCAEDGDIILLAASDRLTRATGHHISNSHGTYHCTGESQVRG